MSIRDFFKRKSISNSTPHESNPTLQIPGPSVKRSHHELDPSNPVKDPGIRPRITDYHPNDQEKVRRAYLTNGPCRPQKHTYPQRQFGKTLRRFNPAWFEKYDWLEYSNEKDAAFCITCYLFRPYNGDQGGGDAFTMEGCSNWKKGVEKLNEHVGDVNSAHNQACRKCDDLLNQEQHLQTIVYKQTVREEYEYKTHLLATIDCIRFLLRQGLAFRGHDESPYSKNQGNFLELQKFLANHNEAIKNVMKHAPRNDKLVSPDIQKDIASAAAAETINVILRDLGDELFAILIDESRDTSVKEQMAVVLRYVDKKGCVIERVIGIMHVPNTTSMSLKGALEDLFTKHNLCMSKLRGQGYDGASNMQGQYNGLKTLILKVNKSAFYVHCFAHQLQLALVRVAKDLPHIALFFNSVINIVNVAGASCKRRDKFRESQALRILQQLGIGEISSGKGLNQETGLNRPCDTRWGSHYRTLTNLIINFSSVIDVLENVVEDGVSSDQKGEACSLLDSMQSFGFIFNLHLMRILLGITNELSKSLQEKDQDIVNAMNQVRLSKENLQKVRETGWDDLISSVSDFCQTHSVIVPRMDDKFVPPGRSRRKAELITNFQHYRVEIFLTCVDKQLKELNDRFDEVNTKLLLYMACLSPAKSFVAFDNNKLVCLAQLYSSDFTEQMIMELHIQLEIYISDVRSDKDFSNVDGISGLAQKMVEKNKHRRYPLVYLLLKLALILPVATATVERSFSAMNIVKNHLRNRMGDDWMNSCLVTYIEKDIFDSIDNKTIVKRFQNMRPRRGTM